MEIKILGFAVILGILHLLIATQAAVSRYGIKWNLSSRDTKVPELDGIPGRLSRAAKNFLETFPFFAAAVLGVKILGTASSLSELGAQLYIGARVVYLPLYIFNVTVVRTLVWTISLVGIGLVLSSIF